MAQLYDDMILLQQVVDPLVGIHKKSQELLKLLKVASKVIDQLQEWAAKYLNALPQLVRKDKIVAEMDLVQFRLHHWNYNRLGEQVTNTISTYGCLHNGFESLAQKYGMPSVGSLEKIKGREIIFQKIRQYIELIKQASRQGALEITKDIILQYSIMLVQAHMKLSWLWNNVQSISKTILIKVLEVKIWYAADFVVWVKVISTEFRACNTYIANEIHEESNDFSIC